MDTMDVAYLGLVLAAFVFFLALVGYANRVTGPDFPERGRRGQAAE